MAEILNVQKVSFGYDKTPFLKNISFNVNEGEFVSLIGENGSGKSTLFKIINGLLKNYDGNIFYKNKNIKNIKYLDRAKEIAVLYQNCECNFPFTCFEVISMAP